MPQPHYLKPWKVLQADWDKMDDEQKAFCARNAGAVPPASKVDAQPKSGKSEQPKTSESSELKNLRDWTEDVDGIPGERIRNCIIFMLDEKKDPWLRLNLTEGYIRRTLGKLGVTGARKLHDDTPPDWSPNPLFKIKTIPYDGELLEYRDIARAPKDSDEWETLHGMLIGRNGKVNPVVLKYMAKADCMKCHGRGGYNEKVFPDSKRRRWQEYFRSPCGCCHANPFKTTAVVQ